jgi:hypothetical protein
MKKLISLILAVALLLAVAPAFAPVTASGVLTLANIVYDDPPPPGPCPGGPPCDPPPPGPCPGGPPCS